MGRCLFKYKNEANSRKGCRKMGKVLTINKFYEIRFGVAHGFIGKLVAYDAVENKVTIQVEDNLIINTNSENLKLVD